MTTPTSTSTNPIRIPGTEVYVPKDSGTPDAGLLVYTPMKTPAQVRQEFEEKGISLTGWAMERGIPPGVVSDLLRGRTQAKRGMAHKAAVALGLKRECA